MSGKRNRKRSRKNVEVDNGEEELEASPYQRLLNTFNSKSSTAERIIKKLSKEKKSIKAVKEDLEKNEIKDLENVEANEEVSDTEIQSENEEEETNDADSEIASDEESIADDLDSVGNIDPFSQHFETDLTEEAVKSLEEGSPDLTREALSVLGNIDKSIPKAEVPKSNYHSTLENASLPNAKVKEKIASKWNKVNLRKKGKGPFSELQNSLFNFINAYQDLFYSQRDFKNGEEIRRLYCLHAMNHISKTRSRILKNNAKIVQSQKDGTEAPEFRDQGLTRPKVLILVPFRECALKIVQLLIQLALPTGEKVQVMQKKRFFTEFGEEKSDESSSRYLPDDFKEMFRGNTDDCFRIGVKVMRKTVKLYADFYSSDILIASPLGLRTIIGSEGEKHRDYDFLSSIEVLIIDQADVFLMQNWEYVMDIMQHLHVQPKESHGTDFSRVRMWTLNSCVLSSDLQFAMFEGRDPSREIVNEAIRAFVVESGPIRPIIDFPPSEQAGRKFKVQKKWSKFYRQTLMFSSLLTPEMNSVYNKYFTNYAGKVRIKAPAVNGSIKQVVKLIPQIFQRVAYTSLADAADRRFNYFINEVLPNFKDSLTSQTAIFIPSYFDFVRIRNYFLKEGLDFLQINEYSERSNISRSRAQFYQKKRHFLLFTERFYFFYRYRIRGVKHVIFYQLPLYPVFYPEIINFMDTQEESTSASATCTILYNKFDSNKLENIVGTQKCRQILSSPKEVHMIVTED